MRNPFLDLSQGVKSQNPVAGLSAQSCFRDYTVGPTYFPQRNFNKVFAKDFGILNLELLDFVKDFGILNLELLDFVKPLVKVIFVLLFKLVWELVFFFT